MDTDKSPATPGSGISNPSVTTAASGIPLTVPGESKPGDSHPPRDVFTDVASVASILGLLITIWVALAVRGIKSHFLAKARLPEYRKKLENAASELSEALGQSPLASSRVQPPLSRLHAHAKSAKAVCPRALGAEFKKLIAMIDQFSTASEETKPQNLRDIYAEALTCATALGNHVEDSKWS